MRNSSKPRPTNGTTGREVRNPPKPRPTNGTTKREVLSVETYLAELRISKDAIKIVTQESNPVEEYLEKYGIGEDALKKADALERVEGRKSALLRHRLLARMILLCALITPMVAIPFWLTWVLSPMNLKHYSEKMQLALLGVLGTDVLGICYVIAQDLFPKGDSSSQKNDELEEDILEDE